MNSETARANVEPPQRSTDGSLESLLGEVAGDYFDRMTSGQRPQIEEYVERYPEIAEQIRCAFPALQIVGDSRSEGELPRTDIDLASRKTVGEFRILRELGRGGMGVVYEAEQLSMGRRVALKVLPFAAIAQEKSLQRFRNEVRAAGSLNHPSIVPIYSVGEERGVHFFAMHLIRGQSMAEVIAQLVHLKNAGEPLNDNSISQALSVAERPNVGAGADASTLEFESQRDDDNDAASRISQETPRQAQASINTERGTSSESTFVRSAASLGVQAAEALQHAHDSGVLHRDIKPGNLMLDAEGRLFITDFGLASIETEVGVTMTGDLVGTLRYMSPEQALANRIVIDHRSDIYSLGATLYELLTLRPPFDGANRQELLKQIAFEDPPKLRQISRSIPRELETIVHKAISKEPAQRYSSAGDLADDLARFLSYKPIKAKPPTLLEHAAKWSMRHQSLIWSSVVLLLMATIALATSTVIFLSQKGQISRALETAKDNFNTSETHRLQAEQAVDFTEKLLYVRNLSLAARARRDGDMRRAAALLRSNPAYEHRPELRGFAWNYLCQRVLPEHVTLFQNRGEIRAARFSPDSRLIAIGAEDGSVELWHAHTRKKLQVLRGHTAAITRLDFHPSGLQLASASTDGTVRIWPLSSTEEVTVIPANPGGETFDVCFSPDGTTLATGGDDNLVKLWSVSPFRKKTDLVGHTQEVRCLAFMVDGKTLASGSNDRTIKLWDVSSGREVDTLRGHSGFVLSLTPDPQGSLLISGDHYDTIRVWDLERKLCISIIRGHLDGVQALAFHGHGDRLFSGDRGGTVRVWDLQKAIQRLPLIDQYVADESVVSVALAHDGETWAALTYLGQLIVHDVQSGQTQTLAAQFAVSPRISIPNMTFSADGKRLACKDAIYARSSTGQWRHERTFSLPSGSLSYHVYSVAVSNDGSKLAIGVRTSVILLDVASGRQIAKLENSFAVRSLRFSPDGTLVAIGYREGGLKLWNWSTDSSTLLLGHSGDVNRVGFIREGRQLFSFSVVDQTIRWWDLATANEIRFHQLSGGPSDVALSMDRSILASTNSDGFVQLWDLRGDRLSPLAQLRGHAGCVASVQFSERGTELLTGAGCDDVILWDLSETPESLDAQGEYLQGHTDRVWSIDVSIDGKQLLTAGRDGSVRIWFPTRTESSFRTANNDRPIQDFEFTGHGSTLVILDDFGVGFRDSRSSKFLDLISHEAKADSLCVAVSADEKTVAVGYRDGTVTLHSDAADSTLEIAAHAKSDGSVDRLAFSPDGTSLVTACDIGNQVRVWDTLTGEMLADFEAAEDCIAFSPDGKLLACVDYGDPVIISTDTWQEKLRLTGHSLPILDVAFNSQGTLFATSSADRKIVLWDTASWTPRSEINAHPAHVASIAFSSDGRTLASGAKDGTIKLWHVELGQELFELERQPFPVIKLAFAPEGEQLLGQLDNGVMIAFEIQAPGHDASRENPAGFDFGDASPDNATTQAEDEARHRATDRELIGGIVFPQGKISFADEVVSYDPLHSGGPGPTSPDFVKANASLGLPDFLGKGAQGTGAVALGHGGRLTLRFTDNILTGSDDASDDLYIFEVGPQVEETFIEISADGMQWHEVGSVSGAIAGIDIDAFGFTSTDTFSYVRLTDSTTDGKMTGKTVGADIDAVGAISTLATGEPVLEGDVDGIEANETSSANPKAGFRCALTDVLAAEEQLSADLKPSDRALVWCWLAMADYRLGDSTYTYYGTFRKTTVSWESDLTTFSRIVSQPAEVSPPLSIRNLDVDFERVNRDDSTSSSFSLWVERSFEVEKQFAWYTSEGSLHNATAHCIGQPSGPAVGD